MKPRDRVTASILKKSFDRLPIKHLAVEEIDLRLLKYFDIKDRDELLKIIGDDFREIKPDYCGPDMGDLRSEHGGIEKGIHGIVSCVVWNKALSLYDQDVVYPLAGIDSINQLDNNLFAETDWFDYSTIKQQCLMQQEYASIFGYCEMDFINGFSILRGQEQILIDIGLQDPLFLELCDRKLEFVCQHIEKALKAGEGLIDFVHFGEDFGSQGGLLISPQCFEDIFASRYRKAFDIVHAYGARTMLHSCGSVHRLIPNLINIGLDVLDVVQTNAVDMDLKVLHKEFGNDISFSGTMCVQKVLPFGTVSEVREEVNKRLEIFKDGGLIIGPSHQIQIDTPIQNILEMYRAAGGYV